MTQHAPATQSNEVLIRVDSDDAASRVSAVLEALGYTVVRQLDEGDAAGRLAWSVDRLGDRHKLTPRERDVLAGVLAGHDNNALARHLEISHSTAKWHLHNVFAKTGVGSREALLRLALQLDGVSTNPEDDADPEPTADPVAFPRHGAPEDITRKIE